MQGKKDFYLKRRDQVFGPIKLQKLVDMVRQKKIRKSDEIADTEQGPWIASASFFQNLAQANKVRASASNQVAQPPTLATVLTPVTSVVDSVAVAPVVKTKTHWRNKLAIGTGVLLFGFFSLRLATRAYSTTDVFDQQQLVNALNEEEQVELAEIDDVKFGPSGAVSSEDATHVPTLTETGSQDTSLESTQAPSPSELNPKTADEKFNLACDFYHGQGVAKDLEKSFLWMKAAAEAGKSEAMHYLSIYYWDGTGTEVNKDEWKRWLVRAANERHPLSMYLYAKALESGDIETNGNDNYWQWLLMAERAGSPEAKAERDGMYRASMDFAVEAIERDAEESARRREAFIEWQNDPNRR